MTEPIKPRPSRTYKNGIGKPVVAKRWDNSASAYCWNVVFPPCNNFGSWIVEIEAKLVRKAQDWCLMMNDMQTRNLRRLSGETK